MTIRASIATWRPNPSVSGQTCVVHEHEHVWLLDPRLRTLEAFPLSGSRYQLLGAWRSTESARVAPFEDLELEVAALWAR